MKAITLNSEVKAVGHYVPGMISNGMLYISGQLPVDANTGKIVKGDIVVQTEVTLNNLERVLKAAGLKKENVVQCRIYISDIEFWDSVNDVYKTFFGDHKPARAIVPTQKLHHNASIEIEAIAEMED